MNGLREVFGVTGLGVGLGIIGEGISGINAGIGADVMEAGETATGFISPMINISMGGKAIRMIKKIGK